jgi:hypothetical protein
VSAEGERGPHPVSWLIGCVLLGWLIVYNLMRFGSSSPSEAAWVSLVVGGAGGVLVFAAVGLGMRRLAASGRVLRRPPAEIPVPVQMTDAQRSLTRAVWPLLAALAAAALVMGAALGADWYGRAADDRAVTLVVLAAWNLLVAVWIGDEALRLMRAEADGCESVALGAALTAILAGVGLARGYMPAGQVVLIVIAGIAGTAAALMVWRLRASRTPPVAGPLVAVVAVLALVLATA